MSRPPCILHCTSEPLVFVGRNAELALLDDSLRSDTVSLVAFVGPGGQGKTAIVQHWLHQHPPDVAGLFFWSFYRGKDVDLCLRHWLAYGEGLDTLPDVSATYCVERLLRILRRERWAIVLDGAEVVQHEDGPWRGRFVHPDLGRLLEELASEPMPGVVVLTTRFELPTLAHRRGTRLVRLDRLDEANARALLQSLGVVGTDAELDHVAHLAGRHAKAVELAGTFLVHWHAGRADAVDWPDGATDEESCVLRVLAAFTRALTPEQQDLLALATAFREPPTEALLLEYLGSSAVNTLLHHTWRRDYLSFQQRPHDWLTANVDELVRLRLLERVGPGDVPVIDAHPLVRRAFEPRGADGQEPARARAGFLRGRPDRRRPETLEEARELIELFHAHCDAGLWVEADGAFRALDNPKHRFLAPVLERDLLSRFFPHGDYRLPPLWPGFGRWRSLAISLEMLGAFEEALKVYRPADAALSGDALLALGRLGPLLDVERMAAPWQTLWQTYRCHALCLAGRVDEGVALACALVPVDVYEWTHVFECLLRADRLDRFSCRSLGDPVPGEHRWAQLARRRILADYRRRTEGFTDAVAVEYHELIAEYDRAGLPVERALTRLGKLASTGGESLALETVSLCQQANLFALEIDAQELLAESCQKQGRTPDELAARQRGVDLRKQHGILGPRRR